jgi:hypothetical protein
MKIYSWMLKRKGTFLGMSAYLKISVQPPAAIFASPIAIEKLIKAEGLILVNLTRMPIQIPKGCCTFQMPLVYSRVCWGFVWCDFGLFSLKNGLGGPRDFSGHFSGSGEDGRLVFAWFWGPGSSGRVVWGDKIKTRHFSGSLGCVGLQHP